MEEEQVKLQPNTSSIPYWAGLIACIVEAILGVLVVTGTLTDVVAGAVMVGMAGITAYLNGNNPALANQYSIKK